MLSREEILALAPPTETVEVEGHGKVYVRGLTAEERDDYEQSLLERDGDGRTRVKAHHKNIRAALAARCLVDERGERMFTDKDIPSLGKVDSAFLDHIWNVARRLSGMSEEATEQVAETFGSAQDDGSSSE